MSRLRPIELPGGGVLSPGTARRSRGRALPAPPTAGPGSPLPAGRSLPQSQEIGGAATVIGSTIPIVYGTRRVTGLNTYYSPAFSTYVYVFGRGGPYTSVSSPRWERPTGTITSSTTYTGTLTQTPNIGTESYDFPGDALVKITSNPTQSAMVVANINGRKVTDWRTSTTSSTQNPVVIAYDILVNLAGIATSKLDATGSSSSWYVAADRCDDTVMSSVRWEINHLLVEPDAMAAAAEVLAYAHMSMRWHKGQLVVLYEDIDATESTSATINAGDWIGAPRVIETPSSGLPTLIRVRFTENSGSIDTAEVTVSSAGVEPSGVVEEEVNLPSFISTIYAERWAQLRLDLTSKERLEIDGILGEAGDALTPGDLVMTYLPWGGWSHACRILSLDPRLDGAWSVKLRKYGADIS